MQEVREATIARHRQSFERVASVTAATPRSIADIVSDLQKLRIQLTPRERIADKRWPDLELEFWEAQKVAGRSLPETNQTLAFFGQAEVGTFDVL